MNKDIIVKQAVEKAYYNLTSIAELNIKAIGGYLGLIIPESEINNLSNYIDEIVNQTFWKLCDEISKHITNDDIEFITYKSFCFNTPSESLINDCFKIINEILLKKKSSNNTTLYSLLDSLKQNHNKDEIEKSLDTIFDILLDYYNIIQK